MVAALESGQVAGYRQAAEVFGVSVWSVGTWWRAYHADRLAELLAGQGRVDEALAVLRTHADAGDYNAAVELASCWSNGVSRGRSGKRCTPVTPMPRGD